MKKVSMLDFRRDAERILARVRKGERLLLTHRGKPVARLEPITHQEWDRNDPFFSLTDLAQPGAALDNAQMDALIYGF